MSQTLMHCIMRDRKCPAALQLKQIKLNIKLLKTDLFKMNMYSRWICTKKILLYYIHTKVWCRRHLKSTFVVLSVYTEAEINVGCAVSVYTEAEINVGCAVSVYIEAEINVGCAVSVYREAEMFLPGIEQIYLHQNTLLDHSCFPSWKFIINSHLLAAGKSSPKAATAFGVWSFQPSHILGNVVWDEWSSPFLVTFPWKIIF